MSSELYKTCSRMHQERAISNDKKVKINSGEEHPSPGPLGASIFVPLARGILSIHSAPVWFRLATTLYRGSERERRSASTFLPPCSHFTYEIIDRSLYLSISLQNVPEKPHKVLHNGTVCRKMKIFAPKSFAMITVNQSVQNLRKRVKYFC